MLSQPQGHSAAGRIMSMKNSIGTIGNRTRDLPVCGNKKLSYRVSPVNLYSVRWYIDLTVGVLHFQNVVQAGQGENGMLKRMGYALPCVHCHQIHTQ